jgi:ABC-type branched-subunit amino acid transport system permease subunit
MTLTVRKNETVPRETRLTETQRVLLKRFVGCLFGGVVLAMMVGTQEGSQDDFGISFHKAVLSPRIVVFLLIGVAIFALITFWAVVKPYVRRPGVVPLGAGLIIVIVAQTVMNWYDPLVGSSGNGKFNAVRKAVDKTPNISGLTSAFFDYLAWTLLGVGVVVCGAAIFLRNRILGYVTAAIGVAGAVIAYLAHRDVVNVGGGIDHSLGHYTDLIGFAVLAAAGITAVHSHVEEADPRGFVERVMTWRPGLVFAVVATIYGLLAYTNDCWFGPSTLNDDFSGSGSDFSGTAISSLASNYLDWLGWTLFAVAVVAGLVAAYFRQAIAALVALVVSLAGIVCTFFTIKSMSGVGAKVAPQHGANWKNLGVGGFAACIAFTLLAAAAVQVLTAATRAGNKVPNRLEPELPVTKAVRRTRRSSLGVPLLIIAIGLAVFYPPMLPVTWQNVLVTQIGVYVLLALGLNVVVGWAGLLDLGYIAFYEVGAYTTAYLCGSLPIKPPDWMQLKPLQTIPFAIIACLIAGVLLGAPTLRLRGDYLAIVTLGFGEITQLVAINDPGGFTGGPQGPTVRHPSIHLGFLDVTWGQDNLPYWYLLLIMLVIVIVLFYRLEGSRLGRAWAAIREDEVAAQASGVNTVRVKLLAFAIGASTSALAGTFFASQVGYFDPSLFTLQASILIVAYVVFGGMGSLAGAMAGAAVLTWLPQFLKDQVPSDDRQMWVGALVLAMMIFRPAGLLPARRRRAELEGLESPSSAEVGAVPASEGL